MDVAEMLSTARESLTVRRVYGEAVERDGVTVIPAASVAGGFGGGTGKDPKGQEGEGGGFGMTGRPAGVYVVRNGEVSWRPAVDVNRVVGVVGLVLVAYLLMRPRLARARARAAG
jgi:uncharacterized spore protein YtfJ